MFIFCCSAHAFESLWTSKLLICLSGTFFKTALIVVELTIGLDGRFLSFATVIGFVFCLVGIDARSCFCPGLDLPLFGVLDEFACFCFFPFGVFAMVVSVNWCFIGGCFVVCDCIYYVISMGYEVFCVHFFSLISLGVFFVRQETR